VLKSEARFLGNQIVELARLTGELFCIDAVVAAATTDVVLDLYQTS